MNSHPKIVSNCNQNQWCAWQVDGVPGTLKSTNLVGATHQFTLGSEQQLKMENKASQNVGPESCHLYTRTLPESSLLDAPRLPRAPIATVDPSEESETAHPE